MFKKWFPILCLISTLFLPICCGRGDSQNKAVQYPAFFDEQEITITGYTLDAMEPFITKDNKYLFFNSLNDSINTSLYYALKTSDTRFTSQGVISGVNGSPNHLDAVASMDSNNIFYFVSTRNYPDTLENYQIGDFDNGLVTHVRYVSGDIYSSGWIVMDAEISSDGNVLYYVSSKFSGNILQETKLGIAAKQVRSFNKTASSDLILQNINNPKYLNYAPSISSNGKELYFTRCKKGTTDTEICVSVRANDNEVFSIPKKIQISGLTVEAPSITHDGGRLYYHKKLSSDGKYHIFTMVRKQTGPKRY